MLGFCCEPKNRRHSHDHRSERRDLPRFGERHLSPCNSRGPYCGRDTLTLGRDAPSFEPRRETLLGGLAPGPMGGLAAYGLLNPVDPPSAPLGMLPVDRMNFANGLSDNFVGLSPLGAVPIGMPLGGNLGGGLGNGSGFGELRNGFPQRLPQMRGFNIPLMMPQQQHQFAGLPGSPLLDPRLQYFDEHPLNAYRRDELPGIPLALNPQENFLRGRIPMQINPLGSPASSIRSGRSGRGMDLVPRMAGGLGNYHPPYVEDYESEVEEYERALQEQFWLGQAGYFWVDGDDMGLGPSGRRI